MLSTPGILKFEEFHSHSHIIEQAEQAEEKRKQKETEKAKKAEAEKAKKAEEDRARAEENRKKQQEANAVAKQAKEEVSFFVDGEFHLEVRIYYMAICGS